MHIDILIDGSGSMGFMKGAGEQHENKYLIDEKHTRTDLVKDILINHVVPNIDFCDTISVETFLNRKKLNSIGKPMIKDGAYVEYPDMITHYSKAYDKQSLINSIIQIENPEPGGTPLRRSLFYKTNKSSSANHHIIVFSDGEGYWESKIDTEWHNLVYALIKELNKSIVIHFIGIAQNESARIKSKELCSRTGGSYLNLQSMNYSPSELNILLFNLKAALASSAIKINATDIVKEQVADTVEIKAKEEVAEKNEQPEKSEIELQVIKNTKSLEVISNQLNNIVNLLAAQQSIQEEVIEIIEDEEHNQKVGRSAEEYLYKELLKHRWNIVWLNEQTESGKPYDFEISDDKGKYYYECKGTIGNANEFILTRNEWLFYLENRSAYRLCFVRNVGTQPSYVRFMDLIDDMKEGRIIPCSSKNVKLKADRIIFQVLK